MRLWVLIAAAAMLAVAGCSGTDGGPRPSSTNVIPPPPPEAVPLRAGPAPIGVGLTPVHRVTQPPRACRIKTKTVVQNGRKRTVKYEVCYRR